MNEISVDSEKYLFAVMLNRGFCNCAGCCELAQTFDPLHLLHFEEFSNLTPCLFGSTLAAKSFGNSFDTLFFNKNQ